MELAAKDNDLDKILSVHAELLTAYQNDDDDINLQELRGSKVTLIIAGAGIAEVLFAVTTDATCNLDKKSQRRFNFA